ncbi:MAG: YebC/PmpR family DNA-binding regulatory protein [Myxococcota bacterium]|jgi:YebC/PmpR family DNA-binding regulatory protein
MVFPACEPRPGAKCKLEWPHLQHGRVEPKRAEAVLAATSGISAELRGYADDMSGHSKWSTIKRKKGALDAKRGKIFTKIIRELSTAASIGGGDPDGNPRLRLVIDKAKGANMPKDNIKRAIEKGVGGGESAAYEEFVYEGYGPGGVAVLIETLSDNKNRTVGEVRNVLSKRGGNLGASGCVAYLFEKKGIISFEAGEIDADALMEAALEADAEDVSDDAEGIEVVTLPGDLEQVRDALGAQGFMSVSAEVSMIPSTSVDLTGKDAENMLGLMEALEDLDDVQDVYANFDISDDDLAQLA